ncbi:MAG: non-canonical purine NTP pyrophosphatase, partial [Clostridia bacterium]|nr:non-canonical purine NTP pyrophosphatase [Clostridia bacterium]
SARYAGEHGDDKANNRLLLEKLQNVENRRAQFVCSIACVFPDGREFTVRGVCEGNIDTCERGNGGFGYDPLFISDAKGSFGLISAEEKNSVSHRANAIKLFSKEIINYI